MRRIRVMLAAAAVLAPVLVSGTATPAAAAGSSVTVTTLGRNGAKVAGSQVEVIDTKTNEWFGGTSGHAISVPKGQYAVVTDVWDPKDDTDTLGARIVTVSGAAKVTIDARQGKPLKVSLDSGPAAGATQDLYAQICVGSGYGGLEAWNTAGHFFVIPQTSRLLRLGYMSRWSGGGTGAGVYQVTGSNSTLTASPGGAFRRASLATVRVQSNRGPQGGSQADLAYQPTGETCQSGLFTEDYVDSGPYIRTAHLSPGRWNIRSDEQSDDGIIGSYDSVRDLVAGKSYSQTFYRAAWGPAHTLPEVWQKRIWFGTDNMFQDPSTAGSEASSMVTSTLSRGSVVLGKETYTDWRNGPGDFSAKMTTPGWYTLNVYAKRYRPGLTYPAGMLSPSASANFHFYANPAVSQVAPVFLTRFIPTGLNTSSHAKPHSTTPVGLVLDRANPEHDAPFHAVTAKKVQAWYSTDNGKTWHGLRVTHSGSTWKTAVPNPASGAVSLSAKVTDAAGDSGQVTVNHAYAVAG